MARKYKNVITNDTNVNVATIDPIVEVENAFGKYTFNGTTTDCFANTSVIFEGGNLIWLFRKRKTLIKME